MPDVSVITSAHNVADARLHRLAAALVRHGFTVEVISLGKSEDAPLGVTFRSALGGNGFGYRILRDLLLPLRTTGKVVVVLAPDLLPVTWLITRIRKQKFSPFAMRRHRSRDEIAVRRRFDRLQHLLARQRLHFGRAELHHVDLVAPRRSLGQRALQNLVGAGAPDIHLDPVFRFERLDQRRQILLGDRGVERQRGFLPRRHNELVQPVGAVVERQR